MLIPEFAGGLGNMMFQLASTYAIAKQTGHRFGIQGIPLPPAKHSMVDYKQNILKKWLPFITPSLPSHKVAEHNAQLIDINTIRRLSDNNVILLSGYFQRHQYLEPNKEEILALFDLDLQEGLKRKYEGMEDAYFLHVRRGDYVGNSFHEMNYEEYYKRATELIGTDKVAYIVSNDIEWCKQWDFLKTIPHRFVEEEEVDTLKIMMRCGLGGIAVNSSFSWWGLYLNTNRPYLILPSKWYPHNLIQEDGYYFKEATVVAV
jgi:hypothetical protein